jgi:protein gp37
MSVNTPIQWCDDTVNPTMGCDGCELWNENTRMCYAGTLTQRYKGRKGYPPAFEQVTTFSGRMAKAAARADLRGQPRLTKPWLNGLPRLIFVSDMGDSLSEAVTFDYLKTEVIDIVTGEAGQRHGWLWLTKRPGRMAEFSAWLGTFNLEWPSNLWAGTTITTQNTAPRVRDLLRVGNRDTIRFLSVEPQLESLNLRGWLGDLDWVIQGGEAGPGAREFKLAWAYEVRDQCARAGTAYFLKQLGQRVTRNGARLELDDGHGGDWSEWPAALRVRRMPITPESVVIPPKEDAVQS